MGPNWSLQKAFSSLLNLMQQSVFLSRNLEKKPVAYQKREMAEPLF